MWENNTEQIYMLEYNIECDLGNLCDHSRCFACRGCIGYARPDKTADYPYKRIKKDDKQKKIIVEVYCSSECMKNSLLSCITDALKN